MQTGGENVHLHRVGTLYEPLRDIIQHIATEGLSDTHARVVVNVMYCDKGQGIDKRENSFGELSPLGQGIDNSIWWRP